MIKNSKPKITIMIPTFNQAAFIREAIDSALAQTYPYLEVVVGDDASTDGTSRILAEIRDPRLKCLRNFSNLGRTGNYRNLLCNVATGDYVINLDGDDYYTDRNFISDAVNLLISEEDIVIVLAKANWKISNHEMVSDIPDVAEATGLQIVKNLPDKKYFFKHMASLYARDIAVKIGFYNSDSNSSDWESLYRLSLRGKVKYLNKVVGVWRIHDRNESSTSNLNKMMENLEIWPSIYKDAVSYGMNPFQAKLVCAKCIAYFSSSFAINISLNGNLELKKFFRLVFKEYKMAIVVILISPKYVARAFLCFIGYYRKKHYISQYL